MPFTYRRTFDTRRSPYRLPTAGRSILIPGMTKGKVGRLDSSCAPTLTPNWRRWCSGAVITSGIAGKIRSWVTALKWLLQPSSPGSVTQTRIAGSLVFWK